MIRHAPSIGLGLGLSLRSDVLGATGPLDLVSGASAAYSTRALSRGWVAGDVVEVRRSSDSTTQDFTAAEVANATMVDWVNSDPSPYSSDFSSDTDGWTGSGSILTFGASIGGESNALMLEGTTGSIGQMLNGALDSESQSVTINFDIYFPSSNTGDSGVRITDNTATIYQDFQSQATDTWLSLSSSFIKGAATNRTILRALDGASTNMPVGDVFYIKNIVFTQETADGFISTWYDQSGNANDATQSTTTAQPKIVENGVYLGGLAFDGVDDRLSFTSSVALSSNDFFVTSVLKVLEGDSVDITPVGNANGNRFLISLDYDSGVARMRADDGSFLTEGFNVSEPAGNILATVQRVSNTVNFFHQSINRSTFNATGESFTLGNLGQRSPTQYSKHLLKEIIIYNSDQSAKREVIETNINDYFGIY